MNEYKAYVLIKEILYAIYQNDLNPDFFYGGGNVWRHLGASGSFTKLDVISEQALLMHKTQATHTMSK